MTNIYYQLAFFLGSALVILSYVFHLFNKNSKSKNLLYFTTVSLINLFLSFLSEGKINVYYTVITEIFEVIGIYLIYLVVHEAILSRSYIKYKRLLLILILTITVGVITAIFTKERVMPSMLFGLFEFYIVLELMFKIFKEISEISKSVKNNIILVFILTALAGSIGWFFENYLDTSEDAIYYLFLSIGLIRFFLKEISKYAIKYKTGQYNKVFEEKEAVEVFDKYRLTDREKEVAGEIIKGFSNQDIADKLFIAVNTVKMHTYNIYKKMKVSKRAEFLAIIRKMRS